MAGWRALLAGRPTRGLSQLSYLVGPVLPARTLGGGLLRCRGLLGAGGLRTGRSMLAALLSRRSTGGTTRLDDVRPSQLSGLVPPW